MAVIVKRSVTSGETDIVAQMLDLIYPVGSYYETSDTSFDPNISWGGTWLEDTDGRVLVALDTGTFNTVGGTGGEETHTLIVNEMPAHDHALTFHAAAGGDIDSGKGVPYTGNGNNVVGSDASGVSNAGGGLAHNNLQPYVVVKRWHRVS